MLSLFAMRTKASTGSLQRERELKLAFDPEDLARLEASARDLSGAPTVEVRHLDAIYFDTPGFDLIREGVQLRLRREGRGGWVQTIKAESAAPGTGIFDRAEFERSVSKGVPSLGHLPKVGAIRVLRRKRVRQALVPVFAARVERRIYRCVDGSGEGIELAIDHGRILAGRQTVPICEVELESKGGRAEALFRLAEELAEAADVWLETRGKADLGYALLRKAPAAKDARPVPRVMCDTPVEEVFAGTLEAALGGVRANERVILASGDPEAVHQMRVALRRLRSCLRMFRNFLPEGSVEEVWESLRGILGLLGKARDWDVFLGERLEAAKSVAGSEPWLTEVIGFAERERSEARAELRKGLASREYRRAILRLTGWITCRQWRDEMTGNQRRRFRAPAERMAVEVLNKGHRHLHRAAGDLVPDDDATWHQLRIVTKKQRYMLENFAPLFPAKVTGRYVDALKGLQDVLGRLQDLAVAGKFLQVLQVGKPTVTVSFLSGMAVAQTRERACLQGEALRCWAVFDKRKAPWQ